MQTPRFLVALLVLPVTATAQPVLFEQLPGHFGGFTSDGRTITVADDFQLTTPALLQRITWWGGYSGFMPTPSDDFTVRVFSDAGGAPGALLQAFTPGNVQRVFTGEFVSPPRSDEFEYTFDLPADVPLEANKTYWLSVINVPSADIWQWEASHCGSSGPDCVQRSFDDPVTGPWTGFFDNPSFRLAGAEGCPEFAISVDVEPDALSPRSSGRWITCFLEPPPPLLASEIDVGSVRLQSGIGSASPDPAAPSAIGDHDGDGTPDLAVKFRRADVIALLDGDPTVLIVTGRLGDQCFRGSDEVRVVPVSAPRAGEALRAGATAEIRWQPASDLAAHTVDVLVSLDDGDTWLLEARGLADTGDYGWIVHDTPTDRARIAVVMVRPTGEGSQDARAGVSGRFTILATAAVGGDGPERLVLRGAIPNPARGEPLVASFSLPDAQPAMLALFDLAGREVVRREVGSLGPGRHAVALGGGGLAAGIYIVRLTRSGASLETRVAVVR